MTFEDFKDVHENDSPCKKMQVFCDEIISYANSMAQIERAKGWRNENDARWWRKEAKAHAERMVWLRDGIMTVLENYSHAEN